MNTSTDTATTASRWLSHLTAAAALTAAAFLLQSTPVSAATPGTTPTIVQLPRVVVTGKAQRAVPMAVLQLPRVVITGSKRVDREPTELVQAPAGKLAAPLVAKLGV